MLKFGIISNLDIGSGLAKVYFEEDDMESAWLKISVMRAGPDQVSFPFNIKEHVWCLMDEHAEYGVIGGAVYDDGNKPAGSAAGKLLIRFADNSTIEYDRNSHILGLDIKGKVNINCTEANLTSTSKVNINAPEVNITAVTTKIDGILNVTGAATVAGVLSMGGLSGISGAPIPGDTAELNVKKVTATEDVTAGTISLATHIHLSASPGNPTTTPVP